MYNFKEIYEGKKSALLIHGRHVETLGWHDIEFGDVEMKHDGKIGQVPLGLELARTLKIDLIIFGTGASKKNDLFESEYILKETIRQASQLVIYLNKRLNHEDKFIDSEDFIEWLTKISFCDTVSQNTTEEIAIASDLCKTKNKTVIFQVSCPSHLPRCLLEWIKYRYKTNSTMIFIPVSSDTFFHGATATDNVIVEYPHRGDAPLYATYQYVAKIFGIMGKGEKTFINFLGDFKNLLKKYEVETSDLNPLIKNT